MSTRNVFWG